MACKPQARFQVRAHTRGDEMKRWTIKEMNEMDDITFTIAVLRERQSMLTNPNSPLYVRIGEAIASLGCLNNRERGES